MKKSSNSVGLFVQVMLCFVIVLFYIISLFEKDFKVGYEITISLTLFTLAYNNVKIYKRKYLTIVYLAFSLLILLSLIFGVKF